MKILVTFAIENEFAPWREAHEFRPARWGGGEVFVTEFRGAEVGVVLTGAGPKHAAAAAFHVLQGEHDAIGLCVSSGLAGALRPEYRVGQILAARAVRPHFDRGGGSLEPLKSSPALLSFAAESGATLVEMLCTSGRVLSTAAEKRRLGAEGEAVEMESFEILRRAEECGIPAVAIRAVSDLADQDLPFDMNEIFTENGQVSVPRVLALMARHPNALPAVMKLGQDSKAAAAELSRFLDRFVARVSEAAGTLETRADAARQ